MTKLLHLIAKIVFNVFVVIFGLTMIVSAVASNQEIENLLTVNLFGGYKTETVTTGKEPVRFKTWYSRVEDVLNGNGAVCAAAEAEGAVLLKNGNDKTGNPALPLKTTDGVSLFGVTAYDAMYSLDGAGEIKVNAERKQTFRGEMEAVGLNVNAELADWYATNTQYHRSKTTSNGVNVDLNGANWSELPASKTAAGNKTAVFVTGRMTNEAIDLPPIATSSGTANLTDGDYLRLTAKEKDVLTNLKREKDAGTFDRIVVLINAANTIQDDFIHDETYGIDAALWIGFPGSDGLSAVADILVGNTTPSGRLADLWYSGYMKNPSSPNFGNLKNQGGHDHDYVVYQEGIYVGYRYAETRYEDYVVGAANAGTYDYNGNVSFPFGYGISYAQFDTALEGVEKDADSGDYTVSVRVTNRASSSASGKNVVQVYLQAPYTAGGTEKAAIELVGFGKTSKLAPGASETVKVTVDANKYFASYDSTANTYVLDQGTYYLTVAENSHDAVNNVLAKKGKTVENTDGRMTANGNADMVAEVEVNESDVTSYEYKTRGGAKVTNLFDHADPNKVDPSATPVTFMSRNNWVGTVKDTVTSVAKTAARDANRGYDSNGNISTSSDPYPTYGRKLESPISLAEMIGVEFEGENATEESIQKWEDFLDQLTWADTVKLIGEGRRRTIDLPDPINKPATNDLNASNGISWHFNTQIDGGYGNIGFSYRFDKENRGFYPTGYPCEGIIAASFNIDVALAVGQAIGEDALWSGTSGLYGFGLNIHRSPYHGRVGEYYSEDPYLSGVMGGYESKGCQSKGCYVYNKHFLLNDQESARSSTETWVTEQTLRQIYLRPFEIAIEIGDAMNVMTAFSRIGSMWAGNDRNLLTNCLRGELGMRGFAVTDWYRSTGMGMVGGILAGNDLPDGSAQGEFNNKGPEAGGYGHVAQAMRTSARRILYTVANSNAMNFIGDDTRVITYRPEWVDVLNAIVITVIVLFSVSAACVAATTALTVWGKIKKKKEVKQS